MTMSNEVPETSASRAGLYSRRDMLALASAAALSSAVPASAQAAAPAASTGIDRSACEEPAPTPARLLFTSRGKSAIVDADGANLRYFDFNVPNQATWQPGALFPDGRRILFLSMEPRRDGPGRPFDEYYTQTPTHLWVHDLETGALDEICTKDRLAPFITPALLIGSDRLLVQVVRNRVGQIFSVALDGSDAREFTRAG